MKLFLFFTFLVCTASGVSSAAGSDIREILVDQDKVRCYSKSYDMDRDGYAARGAPAVLFEWTGEKMHPCPMGFLPLAEDCNDLDSSVHPFKRENGFNRSDDNCNGLTDEVSFDSYQASQSQQIVWSPQSIDDVRRFSSGGSQTVWVETQIMGRTDTMTYALSAQPSAEPNKYVANLPLRSKDMGQVYRTRFLESDRKTAISDWHYGYFPLDSGPDEMKRAIVLQNAFFEFGLSQAGEVGYAGKNPDGLRYGAGYGFWWCSEFYSYSARNFHSKLKNLASVSALKNAFKTPFRKSSIGQVGRLAAKQKPKYILKNARPGDYLAVSLGKRAVLNHSTMVLATSTKSSSENEQKYTGYIWLLEGNYFNKVVIKERRVQKDKTYLGRLDQLSLESPVSAGIVPTALYQRL